jgi:GT2 family glycosyltransferase
VPRNPLVSVILPVHNGEGFLAEAIESVLAQDYRPIEIIVIDDGSTDATARIAVGFEDRVRYYHQPNAGPAAARNFGVREANGEFIAFIDADDLWPGDKLATHMRCFQAYPALEIVQGLIRRIRLRGAARAQGDGPDVDFLFFYSNLGSMVMRRSVFERIGYFEAGLAYHEDTDFWLRAREQAVPILALRRLTLIYRIHGANLTTDQDVRTTGFLNIIRRSIGRRRRASGFVKGIDRLLLLPDLRQDLQEAQRGESKAPESWPLVSIILYAGWSAGSFDRALASIVLQDYRPTELLIVGARPDYMSPKTMPRFEHVELMDASSDLASGLNAAIERAHGELVCFLDSGAEWAAGKLHIQAAYLLEHSNAGYVASRSRQILLPDLKYPAGLIDSFAFRKELGDLLGTLMVRRATFTQVGGFGIGLPGLEETDWFLRATDKGVPRAMLPNTLLLRSVSPDSRVEDTERMKVALLESVRSSIRRKRRAGWIRGELVA